MYSLYNELGKNKSKITIQEYVGMIKDMNIDNKDLLTYKGYLEYINNRLRTESDFKKFKIQKLDSDVLSSLEKKTNQVDEYCENNPNVKECQCYSSTKNVLKEIKESDIRRDAMEKRIRRDYDLKLRRYNDHYRRIDSEFKKKTVNSQWMSGLSDCCVSKKCTCLPTDVLEQRNIEFKSVKEGGLIPPCRAVCGFKIEYINSQLEKFERNNKPSLIFPPRDIKNYNMECCVNEIQNNRDVRDIIQICDQKQINEILNRKAKEQDEDSNRKAKEEKEEAERKAREEEKEEAERKAKEEEKEEAERNTRKQDEDANRNTRKQDEDANRNTGEQDEENDENDNNMLYIAIVSFVFLLIIIITLLIVAMS